MSEKTKEKIKTKIVVYNLDSQLITLNLRVNILE